MKPDTLIRIALLSLFLISATMGTQATAQELPDTQPPTREELYAAQAAKITADIKVDRCLQYADTVRRVLDWRYNEFHILTVEDVPLVLALMANESGCNPSAISKDGRETIGLMQVGQKDHYDDCLHTPSCNIFWGSVILDRTIEKHGLRLGIAAYNCSLDGIANDMCGTRGGWHYQEEILEFWLPLFLEKMDVEYDLGKFELTFIPPRNILE